MCGWAMKAAEICTPLISLLKKEIRGGPAIHADETTLQVLREPDRAPTKKSYSSFGVDLIYRNHVII